MPSLTPMVLNRSPTRPAACTPSLTYPASLSRCMLQVFPSHHMLQMPTCGFCRSVGVRPVPYNIACDAPWLRGCVILELYLFSATLNRQTYTRAAETQRRKGKRLFGVSA